MYSLYFAGTLLEQVIGSARFTLLYFGSGIAGSAGRALLSPNSVTVGASGAIFGILGGLFVLERQGRIHSGGQILGLIILNLVFTFAVSGISVGGHLGGLVAGIVLMLLSAPVPSVDALQRARDSRRDRGLRRDRVRQGSRLPVAD